MPTSTPWQPEREAAEGYEQILVPAILGPFAHALVEAAHLVAGELVLDVGCGTGVAARMAARYLGPTGRVIAVDTSIAMIEVARSLPSPDGAPVEWHQASAYRLPVPDRSVDVVLCAQTLPLLVNRPAALSEMLRVLRPGGRVAVSVWCPIEENPYFLTLADTVAQHLGPGAAVWLEAPFALTNHQYIFTLLNSAGLHDVEVTARQLDLELPPLEEFAHGHIRTTSISGDFSAAPRGVQQTVISSIVEQLAPFKAQGPDGSGISGNVRIPFRSYLAVARVR